MSRNGFVLLAVSMLILSCLAMSAVAMDAAKEKPVVEEGPHPEELYPDADVIITADSEGNTVMTFKAYGDYKVTESHPSQWFSKTVKSKDLTVREMSLAKENMEIVFDGATVGKLTLFSIDSKTSMNSAINVHFTMVSGSIQSFSLMSITNGIKQYMSTSYEALPTPIRTADLDFISGTVDLFNPSSQMLSVNTLYLDIGQGMTVNRLYTTGENGKYSNVHVTLTGAHIGYMTNVSSKIGYLQYDFVSGEIDYLCLGANTEHTSNRIMSGMATSYVSGDVNVRIGSMVTVKNCIIGAGIINMPKMLCNGDTLASVPTHMVVIDAPDVTIYNDTAFLNERRTSAYHFNNYKIGQNPYASSVMDSFNLNNESSKVYADDGVWPSISSSTLPAGSILSLNTRFYIQTDAVFTVPKGATMYNVEDIVLCGTLNIEGKMVNNSVIQCRSSSEVNGELEGIGYLADFVYYSSSTDSIKVMSQRDAVVISLQDEDAIESITATLGEGKATVVISTDGSNMISGNQFVIALTGSSGSGDFDKELRLDIRGIDSNILEKCTVNIHMNVDPLVCNAIYVQDPQTDGFDILTTAEYDSQIDFAAGKHQKFYLLSYTTERPELPDDSKDSGMSTFDYALIAAIVAVFAVTLYALFTMKRD